MSKQAQLADGTVLDFPDDTPDDVIQRKVKELVTSKQPNNFNQSLQSGTSKATTIKSQADVDAERRAKEHKLPISPTANIILGIKALLGDQQSKEYLNTGINNTLATLGTLSREGAAGAVGTAAGIYSGSPVLGSATMAETDRLLRRATGKEPVVSQNPLVDVGAQTLLNEVGGRILGSTANIAFKRIPMVVKEALSPGSVVDPMLSELEPTFSQYSKFRTGFQVIEDVAGKENKVAAVINSQAKAKDQAERIINNITARKVDLATGTHQLQEDISQGIKANWNTSVATSDGTAGALKLIAKNEKATFNKVVQPATTTTSPILGAGGQPNITNTPAVTQAVDVFGPIELHDAAQAAKAYLDDIKTALVKPDADNPILQAATNIISNTSPEFDPATGLVTKIDPIDFETAWKWKKQAGDLGFGSPTSDLSSVDSKFRKVFYAFDNDIQNSMANWNNNGTALDLWGKTKYIVNTRHELFNPTGEIGKGVKIALNSLNHDASPELIQKVDSAISDVIDDPKKLKRTLLLGDVDVLTDPAAVRNPVKVTTSKQDLGAFTLQKLFSNSRIVDNQTGVEMFDAQKLKQNWQNPEKQDSFNLLFNQNQRADISKLIDRLQYIDQKLQTGGSTYLKIKGALGAVAFVGGIADAMVQGGNLSAYAVTGGGIAALSIQGKDIAKFLINPNYARLGQALIMGDPLGMSHKMVARSVINGLVGSRVEVQLKNGQSIPAKITKNGIQKDEQK